MTAILFAQVVEAVVRRAQRQGHVLPGDVRTELRLAELPEDSWKDVIDQARPALVRRQGRYYHKDALSPRLVQELKLQRAVEKAVRELIKEHRRQKKDAERRGQARVDFIQPVQVRTEDGQDHRLLSRDLSASGIRLLGTRSLLGQKVEVALPSGTVAAPMRLLTRILWTCAVGDDLYENGGTFLEQIEKAR